MSQRSAKLIRKMYQKNKGDMVHKPMKVVLYEVEDAAKIKQRVQVTHYTDYSASKILVNNAKKKFHQMSQRNRAALRNEAYKET